MSEIITFSTKITSSSIIVYVYGVIELVFLPFKVTTLHGITLISFSETRKTSQIRKMEGIAMPVSAPAK